MSNEMRTLGQLPVKVKLADVELNIVPPSSYRLTQISACIDKAKTEEKAEGASYSESFYDVFRLICKGKDKVVNGELVEGDIPDVLKDNKFWDQQVQTAEIAGLFGVFIELTDVESLRKNTRALMG